MRFLLLALLAPPCHGAKLSGVERRNGTSGKHAGGGLGRRHGGSLLLMRNGTRVHGMHGGMHMHGGSSGSGSGNHTGSPRATAARLARVLRLALERPAMRTMRDLDRVAAAVATDKRELVFTTVSMDRPLHQLVLLRQWVGNLRASAPHALMIGAAHRTCAVALNASIPCFVDELAPQLKGRQNFFGHQVVTKWWYARALLSLRYNIIFSDPDIAWVREPFAEWRRDSSFDLQGLSDIRSTNLTTQAHHEITCIRGWMESMYEHGRRSVYPCQSTGLWYMRDGVASRAFLDGMYGYIEANRNEWEQKAFQLVVMRYLVGLGDELPPLRYRLLPPSRFVNVEFYEERLREVGPSAAATLIATHCGYLKNTADKLEHLELTGFLHRGLSYHRKLHAATRAALGSAARYAVPEGDEALYGWSDARVRMVLKRKNHSTFRISVRR